VRKHNPDWAIEADALKKIQHHFDLNEQADVALRHNAIDEDITPSNLIRKVLGLNFNVIRRSRISVQFSPADIKKLSARFNVDIAEVAEIKRRVREEIQVYYKDK